MWKVLASISVAGLIAVATPSAAVAGGALATVLLPTIDAVDCGAYDPCESNGSGSTATLKIRGVNNMSFIMEGMLPGTSYSASLAAAGCGNVIATFTSSATGSANYTAQNLASSPSNGDLVEVCRQDDLGDWYVIYSGNLGRLNG